MHRDMWKLAQEEMIALEKELHKALNLVEDLYAALVNRIFPLEHFSCYCAVYPQWRK